MSERQVFPSELGWMGIVYTSCGILRLVFDQPSERATWQVLGEWPDDVFQEPSPELGTIMRRLSDYAHGHDERLADLPIDWTGFTPFQVRVLQACRRIPWGETCSYADLAAAAGSPKAARAVGSVMARNRVPLVIPCHRVVGSGGALGGFSSRSGLKMKRRLLQREAAGRCRALA